MPSSREAIDQAQKKLFELTAFWAEQKLRRELAQAILVGPYDDYGVAEPGKEKGAGFAIYIGEWRLGWWAERREACEVADGLSNALLFHKVDS